jgi:hypothetical protein
VLITYLYVSPAHAHRGHARALLARALTACRALGTVRAVLAEAEWPELLRSAGASAEQISTARLRLRFFARIGARLLNIEYVQPPLAPGKRAVSHLKLFWLPLGTPTGAHGADDALAPGVDAFIAEFFAALAEQSGTRADDSILSRMREQVAGARPLTSPLPRLQLSDAAICFHFVEGLGHSRPVDTLLRELASYKCPVLHSMETDLLSRAYRMRRLFRTVCMTQPETASSPGGDAGLDVEITFPPRVAFRSENRVEERHWPLRTRKVRAYLAATFFFRARVLVWHLTLKADSRSSPDDAQRWLDELDLIALLKLADDGAEQESEFVPGGSAAVHFPLEHEIRFRLGDARPALSLSLSALLDVAAARARERFPDVPTPSSASASQAATVQILSWPIQSASPMFAGTGTLEREAMCGVVTGILDFDEIDEAEARDTLTPSVPLENALLRIHRGLLVHIAQDDRSARTVAGSVGISPYLIIPHATVLCNEYLLHQVEGRALQDEEPRSAGALSGAVKALEDTLRRKWVPNAFFYSTEQKLYDCALVESGTSARRANAEDLLLRLKTNLQLAREWQRERFEAVVAGLLAAISVMALDQLFGELTLQLLAKLPLTLVALDLSDPTRIKLLGHGLTFLLAIGIGLAVWAWKRPRRPGRDT